MKIIYGKELSCLEESQVNSIAKECDILFDTARLLFCRGINSVEKVKSFLNPGRVGFNNPFLLNNMQEAVDRIALAKNFNENVLIFGDYDADGISAASVLYGSLGSSSGTSAGAPFGFST